MLIFSSTNPLFSIIHKNTLQDRLFFNVYSIGYILDIKEKVESGEHVDSKNIRKHKNDVFRLLANVPTSSRVDIAKEIQDDIIQFIEQIKEDKPDLKKLGLKETGLEEMLDTLAKIFLSEEEV